MTCISAADNVVRCWMMTTLLAAFVLCDPHSRRAIDSNVATFAPTNNQSSSLDSAAVLPVGEAFNVFQSYGLLAFNINVAPLILLPTSRAHLNNGSFQPYPLFQLITHPVLDRRLFTVDIKRQPNNNPRVHQQNGLERSVRLHLCPNTESLTTRLLQGFTVDGLQKPWWAFTASWKKHILPRVYGVPANYLTDDYVFLLVRIKKRSIVGSVNGTLLLEPDLLAKLPAQTDNAATNKSWRSAVDFFYQFGTHVITEYSAGDALFQVIVYNSTALPVLAEKMIELRNQVDRINPTNATRIEWIKLIHDQSPPVHIGKLQLISGNRSLINWLEPRLALSSLPETLPSSIRLLGAPVLFNIFYRQLQPRAVLSMNLASITKAMPETPRRQWLNDVLFNLLRMWESNM